MRLTLCQGPFAKCQVLCCNWVEKCVGLQDFALRTRDHSIWRISNKSMARHCHQSMARHDIGMTLSSSCWRL